MQINTTVRVPKEGFSMGNTILVIGDKIRSDQYQYVRLEQAGRRRRPESIRVSSWNFFRHSSELMETYPELSDDDEAMASKHLETFGKLVALVMDEKDWTLLSEYVFIKAAIEKCDPAVDVWVVYPDGRCLISS